MKIYSTGKKIEKEDHATSDEIFKNDDDETDANLDDDSREKTPVPPKFNVKPSEIDDLAAQLNANVSVSSDSEVQFNIKPADTSFQSVSNEAEFSISNAGASKICSDEVLVSIATTPNVPANITTKLIKSSENTNNTTPKDAEQRIQAQEPSAPHKNENDDDDENSNTEPRDPQVDTIKKHLFDSPIPNSKNEDAPKLVSTPKIGTPLNVSFKNTPTNSSLKKVKSGGICIGNDGTPVDVPKLRPGNEPPTPPNKNEVATNVPDEEVQTIKKHLFDSPMGATAAPATKSNFVKTDVEESTTTTVEVVVNTTVESIINDEEISKTDADGDAAKCLLIDMQSSSSACSPDDAEEISRKNEQVDNIILNTSVRGIKDNINETAVVAAVTATADEQPEKTIQESAVEITNITPSVIEDQAEMNGEEEQQEIDEPALPKSSGYNLDFLDKLDDPNFNPFETKTKVKNIDSLPSNTTTTADQESLPLDEKVFNDPNFNPFETKSKVSNDDSVASSKPTAIVKPQSEMKEKVETPKEEDKPKEEEDAKKDEKPKKKPLPPKPWLKKKKKLPSNSDTSKTDDDVSGKLKKK